MSDYWFFLSYARRDAIDNKYIEKFFNHLAQEVARIAGLPSQKGKKEMSFWDKTGIEPGDRWPDTLADALQTSRVLVCLYSRGYFNSEYCGKELKVFLSRLDKRQLDYPTDTKQPPLILPVLWDRPDRLPKPIPAAVSDMQYLHKDFGDVYAQEGLLYLMKLRKNQDEYEAFIDKFAGKLVQAAETYSLPPLENLPVLLKVESAFQIPTAHQAVFHKQANVGPEAVRFIFVAGKDYELAKVRQEIHGYGAQGGRDWRPYLPDVNKTVGVISQGIATAENLFYEDLPLCEDVVRQIHDAEKANTIIIVLVDPWSIQIEWYQKHMLEYDKSSFVNSGVLIPWNEANNETEKNKAKLRTTIEKTFHHNLILNSMYFRDSICAIDELEKEIVAAISEARRRLIRTAEILRPVENLGNNSIPMINGPGGAG
jgi:FxsC-like protein